MTNVTSVSCKMQMCGYAHVPEYSVTCGEHCMFTNKTLLYLNSAKFNISELAVAGEAVVGSYYSCS